MPLSRAVPWPRTAALWAAVAITLVCTKAPAQTPVVEGSTLRVYTNLLQIPVLVLDRHRRPLPPLRPDGFLVRLGQGAPFHPPLVRQEGEDPITLAVLLDGAERDSLLPVLGDAMAAMVGEELLPHDRVAVYAMDGCKLRRLSTLVPASVATVRVSVDRAATFAPYSVAQQGACVNPVTLWDATEYLVRTLSTEPGRRVVLTVTNGRDRGSRNTPDGLHRSANLHGVTVFALAERSRVPERQPQQSLPPGPAMSSDLAEVAEGSGGLVWKRSAQKCLQRCSALWNWCGDATSWSFKGRAACLPASAASRLPAARRTCLCAPQARPCQSLTRLPTVQVPSTLGPPRDRVGNFTLRTVSPAASVE